MIGSFSFELYQTCFSWLYLLDSFSTCDCGSFSFRFSKSINDNSLLVLSNSSLFELLLSAEMSFGDSGSKGVAGLGGESDPLPLPLDGRGRGRCFASSFFHFILLFWNHILMCLSVKFNIAANSIRLGLDMYLLKWNSFSNSSSWPLVYAVRVRLFSSSIENWAPIKINLYYQLILYKIKRWRVSWFGNN